MDDAELSFGPDRRAALVAFVAADVAAVAAFVQDDPAPRLFAGVVAVVLWAFAAADLIFAPRLVADGEGLRVRTPFERVALPWSSIDLVTATTSTRHGVRSVALEIDAGQRLVVLGRRDLAAEPGDVANAIAQFRATR